MNIKRLILGFIVIASFVSLSALAGTSTLLQSPSETEEYLEPLTIHNIDLVERENEPSEEAIGLPAPEIPETGEIGETVGTEETEETEEVKPEDLTEDLTEEPFPTEYFDEEYISYAQADTILRVAVVLSDIYSKRDMEFTRGMILGIDRAYLPANSLSLKIVNGEISPDSLEYEFELFGPHVIFTTQEKEIPRNIISYAEDHQSLLVNVFDALGDDYLTHPSVYQLLPPNKNFYEGVALKAADIFQDSELLVVDDPESNDVIAHNLLQSWAPDAVTRITAAALKELPMEDRNNVVIYLSTGSSSSVKDIMETIRARISDNPWSSIKVLGRPFWIGFTDISSLLTGVDAYIPAKCFFDPSSYEGKQFIADYKARFDHSPIKSFPVYAAMGYDVARFFLPRFLADLRGHVPDWESQDMLQSRFNLSRSGWNSGVFNTGSYVLNFNLYGSINKIPVSHE